MKELKQAIEKQDHLMASLQLAKVFQPDTCQPDNYQHIVELWVERARKFVGSTEYTARSFNRFIQFFYVELAFSGDEKNYFSCQYSLLDHVLDYRTGIPVSLAIVFQSIGKRLGFDVCGVNFPGHFLLKCRFQNHPDIYVDPLNGKLLSRQDLESMYFAILKEMEDEKMPEEALHEASCAETIVRLLHNLKASYINEKCYSEALIAVELLVNLCPNDPYERRDRGFLLHQLDCTQVAIADYQYFIRKCPKDPATQLLQAQLQQLSEQASAVFH
ncbi:tetratricopeptide repeat protein [uncultured Paraglaciecola sp.]|uniref:SirB1 family protein n=1 Tax=uncultured Paraglaciecola sp. TaxID=1765024 RepID=UPI00263193B0|nr:tetratricopeptide repeat protein [uncultured Paraglaciecola sp.]